MRLIIVSGDFCDIVLHLTAFRVDKFLELCGWKLKRTGRMGLAYGGSTGLPRHDFDSQITPKEEYIDPRLL